MDLPMGQRKDRQRVCVCDLIPGEKAAVLHHGK